MPTFCIFLGGQSVHLHVLSPASRGLFKRAIMASGTALNPSTISQLDHVQRLFQFGIFRSEAK